MRFTERGYNALLEWVAARYSFEPFGTTHPGPHVLWRHDIDMSPHRAARLAALEAGRGLRATYFVHLHSHFYNALDAQVRDRLFAIAEHHDIGLHFEAGFYGELDEGSLGIRLDQERAQLRWLLGVRVRAFAFHNVGSDRRFTDPMYAGLINAYGLMGYDYVSDSNGLWRFRSLAEVLASAPRRLHVLTHPEWWTPEPMSPRARVQRAIDGRATATGRWYDELLAAAGRKNVA